jgi:tetratricopeptide (TPR) repeat protein
MGNAYCVATPLKSEQRLSNARFAYATFEAQRLIEEHGIECVAQILDRACKEPRNDSRNLVAATREVTGVDVQKRFERYQTFQTKEQGLKKYADRVKAAPEGKGYQEVLSSFLRALELEGPAPKTYAAIAFVLTLMGNEQGGDRAMEQQLTLSKRDGRQEDYFALQKVFVEYALQCRSLKKAHEAAEEVLKKEPDFVPALAVRMDRLKASGDVSGAKEVARRVLELDKDSASAACRLAQEVLSLKEMK